MQYDRDLIQTIYILQQTDEALAARMWNRLMGQAPKTAVNDLYVSGHFVVPAHIVAFMKCHHNAINKVDAIRAMRVQTGWGLKEAKDAVDMMIAQGILT